MTAVEVASGIYRLSVAPAGLLNSFALRDEDGRVTLVDCGLGRAAVGPGRPVRRDARRFVRAFLVRRLR